jgi:Na+/melibiose symporter-like transporter
MQNNLAYTGLAVSWGLLIVSITLAVFSKYKHTQFKQILLRFLNLAFLFQLVVAIIFTFNNATADLTSLIASCWILITIQLSCNLMCFMSVKRRKAKIKPTLDHFSMD